MEGKRVPGKAAPCREHPVSFCFVPQLATRSAANRPELCHDPSQRQRRSRLDTRPGIDAHRVVAGGLYVAREGRVGSGATAGEE
ncbi:hypothetical protein FRACA_620016 [Frankia canadensis]|uniref:Uncharacterized protein n=1 Tax=Frankia canadensis TaxID=1836972 RepID=A0A2I2KZU0_9ACTN|nr:hypothetical protein FRACA_620016 [Frankia canadensis]SOU58457.1 hypothetical protein FRACA_620016 [Frankia canadensis]